MTRGRGDRGGHGGPRARGGHPRGGGRQGGRGQPTGGGPQRVQGSPQADNRDSLVVVINRRVLDRPQ